MEDRFRSWDRTLKKFTYFTLEELMRDSLKSSPTGLFAAPFEDQDTTQSTGYTDKSGKLIYYGDIYIHRDGILRPRHIRQLLREKHKEIYIVNELTVAHWNVDMDMNRVLVIGNKFLNPELVTNHQ